MEERPLSVDEHTELVFGTEWSRKAFLMFVDDEFLDNLSEEDRERLELKLKSSALSMVSEGVLVPLGTFNGDELVGFDYMDGNVYKAMHGENLGGDRLGAYLPVDAKGIEIRTITIAELFDGLEESCKATLIALSSNIGIESLDRAIGALAMTAVFQAVQKWQADPLVLLTGIVESLATLLNGDMEDNLAVGARIFDFYENKMQEYRQEGDAS